MSETAFPLVESAIPSSSDLRKDVWTEQTPEQLVQEGYAEHVDYAPSHAQGSTSAETKSKGVVNGGEQTPTAIRSTDGLVIQLPVPRPMPPVPSLHALQEWEGYVLEKGEEEFAARLLDLTTGALGGQTERVLEEEAIIPLSEVSDYDLKRLRPGSVFRWVIGYERSPSGTKRRVSQIVFRDLPAMTRQDRDEGSAWARRVARSIPDL